MHESINPLEKLPLGATDRTDFRGLFLGGKAADRAYRP